MKLTTYPLLLALGFLTATGFAQNLLKNGDFDDPAEPLSGWISDYAWSGNHYYVENKKFISIITEGARKNVVKFAVPGDSGTKLESKPFPLEPGFRYICNLDVKGGGYRIYFAGYRWAPGVKPHDNPELSELRLVYQSKAASAVAPDWKQEKIELPGVKLSETALEHLKEVRFLTVYIWFVKPGFVDKVSLSKVPDPAMKFE